MVVKLLIFKQREMINSDPTSSEVFIVIVPPIISTRLLAINILRLESVSSLIVDRGVSALFTMRNSQSVYPVRGDGFQLHKD